MPDVERTERDPDPRTGWRTVAVPGLVPDAIFFAMLSERVFPVGNFIRTREQLDYLEAPDCFHDMFGHIPMLAHHDFAEMAEQVGRLGRGRDRRGRRAIGPRGSTGTASSSGWRSNMASSRSSAPASPRASAKRISASKATTVERLPFSVERAVHTPYKHDAFQPRYLVSQSLDADGRRSPGADARSSLLALQAAARYSPAMADQPTTAEYRSGHDPRTLRDALGCFATGVTVVTCLGADGEPARADRQQLHLGLARPAAAARLHRQGGGERGGADRSVAFRDQRAADRPAAGLDPFLDPRRGPVRDDALVVRRSGRADPQGFARRVRMRALRGL